MAKLVSVVKGADHVYSKRQMPLVVEDKSTMVLQFPDNCLNCGLGNAKKSDVDRFITKYMSLNSNERLAATTTTQSEIAEQLACLVPCVGCRKSVERMLDHLALSGNGTLDPMQITTTRGKRCQISLKKSYKEDPKLLFAMFYIHGNKLRDFVGTIPRSKKNKRCQLHSLDTQKTKTTNNWVDLWALLSLECREQILMIDYQKFMEAMVVYLEKHRFCIECKTKVLHAHGLLIGDDGKKKDKSYCPAMYEGINYCKNAKHVHIRNSVEFIGNLIARAEPDLMGSRRERHAKTLDIAQEEVLTCLGSYLYARFNGLLQKIKLEEQTWQQLFYIGICCLRQNFEMALEEKQGISQLELLCSEIELEEKNREHKKEMKRKKKKKSKQSKRNREITPELECDRCISAGGIGCAACNSSDVSKSPSILEPVTIANSRCIPCSSVQSSGCEGLHSPTAGSSASATSSHSDLCGCKDTTDQHSDTESEVSHSPVHVHRGDAVACCAVKTSISDLGYSSGPESCDSCSASSNGNEVIPIIDTSSCDKHASRRSTGEMYANETGLDHSCDSTSCDCATSSTTSLNSQRSMTSQQNIFHSTLQDMLESCDDKEEEADEELISKEDIAAFKANMPKMARERLQLREKLKQRFDDCMQKQRNCCSAPVENCQCAK